MAPLHLLGQSNQIEMQHDIFGYMMHMAPILHAAHGINSGIITFLRSR